MEWLRWILNLLFGADATPWKRPRSVLHWLAFVPAVLIAAALGVSSAVVSSPLWLPAIVIGLAPIAIAARLLGRGSIAGAGSLCNDQRPSFTRRRTRRSGRLDR